MFRTTARVGDLDLNDTVQDNATHIDIPVEKVFIHEQYNAVAHIVDIALVKLKYRVKFTSKYVCVTENKGCLL